MSLQISPEIAAKIEAKLDDLDAESLALVQWRLEYVKNARPKQLPPDGDWIYFMMLMGRSAGYGKAEESLNKTMIKVRFLFGKRC